MTREREFIEQMARMTTPYDTERDVEGRLVGPEKVELTVERLFEDAGALYGMIMEARKIVRRNQVLKKTWAPKEGG